MTHDPSSTDILHRLADFLKQQNPLLTTHPNDCNLDVLPEDWNASPADLTRYYKTGHGCDNLPDSLKTFIDDIRKLQMPREPIDMTTKDCLLDLPTKKGMSPKKLHEVQRMASYVKHLVNDLYPTQEMATYSKKPYGQLHIVDVGAGQGYLTRALGALFPDARLLALDADHGQTEGAQRRGKAPERKMDPLTTIINARIDHKTVLITPDSLLSAVDSWIGVEEDGERRQNDPVPVLFVALHACGSLTPDMLKAFTSRVSDMTCCQNSWFPLSVVAVGCCYNLMHPSDYPLSQGLRNYKTASNPPLPASAFHLAAQIPLTWLEGDPTDPKAELQQTVQLASRKIAWRAMLGFALAQPHRSKALCIQEAETTKKKITTSSDVPVKWWVQENQPSKGSSSQPTFDRGMNARSNVALSGVGMTNAGLRLGKLPESAYAQGWEHFLKVAGEKLGVAWEFEPGQATRDSALERRIEVLHTLRCFVGPVVETAILLDRLQYTREQMQGRAESVGSWEVELVNFFDQGVGSGRNVAVVVAPAIPSYERCDQ